VSEPQQPPQAIKAAAVIVAVQATGLVVAAIVLSVLALVHTSTRLWAALSVIGFALLGALVLLVCARGLLGLRPSARSPIVLLELITLPVGYSLGIQAGRWPIGLPVLASAVAVLVLLFTPAARRALDRVL
jgi:hypothetical protein